MSALSVAYQKLDARSEGGGEGNQTLHCLVNRKPIRLQLTVCVSLYMHYSLTGLHIHSLRTETFSSHPQQVLLLSR